MARRTKGTGCITEMKSGKYKYRGLLRVGINANGNPKNKIFYGNTKKEVELNMKKFLEQDSPEKLDVITFNKGIELLIQDSKDKENKLKTMSIIETTCKILQKHWGNFSIDKIFKAEVKQQFNEWKSEYSYSQRSKLRNYGKKAFTLVCDEYKLDYSNPFDIPIKTDNKAPKANYFTPEELYKIFKEVKNDTYAILLEFLYETGVRIGEALALKWKDIDFDNKRININKTLSETKLEDGHYGFIVTTPKTKLSYRKVPLPEKLECELSNLSYKYNNPESPVFATEKGTYISARNVLRSFNKAMQDAGVEKNGRGIHSIRHSTVIKLFQKYAALGKSNDIAAIDISKIIGNTLNMSAYLYDNEQNERVDRISKELKKAELNSIAEDVATHSLKDVKNATVLDLAQSESEEALNSGRITFGEMELYKKYIYQTSEYLFAKDKHLPFCAVEIYSDEENWNYFKKHGKLSDEIMTYLIKVFLDSNEVFPLFNEIFSDLSKK